jgi:hypothetical protein
MKTHTRSILVFVLAVAIIATYASLATRVTAAYAEVKSDLSVMTAPTCVGIGRYERIPGEEILVFDTCRGRMYHVTPARQWEVIIPAVPDIPPTLAERAEWQRLNTEGLVGQ